MDTIKNLKEKIKILLLLWNILDTEVEKWRKKNSPSCHLTLQTKWFLTIKHIFMVLIILLSVMIYFRGGKQIVNKLVNELSKPVHIVSVKQAD